MDRSFDDCKKLLKEFVNEKLFFGNLDSLKDFNFWELKGCKKYGKCTRSYFDPDDTELARCIYVLVWGNESDSEFYLPGFSYSEIGIGKKFGGDALNTFKAVFGGKVMAKDGNKYEKLWRAKKYINDDDVEMDKIKKFEGVVASIGNFSFLPDLKIGNSSINVYRGIAGWKDFYDKFLEELKKCYEDEGYPLRNRKFYALKAANDDIYFNFVSSIEEFKKRNFLDCYFDGGRVKKLFFDKWIDSKEEMDSKRYKRFINMYIDTATKIIGYRAGKIIEKLRPLLEE